MLSAHALAALAEFHADRDAHESKFNDLKAQADQDAQLSMEAFTEDWNKSQFWVNALTSLFTLSAIPSPKGLEEGLVESP